MQILSHAQVYHKIIRLAYEIIENNLEEDELFLLGINNNGYRFAEFLISELKKISPIKLTLSRILLDPADPLCGPIQLSIDKQVFQNKTIIVVDDVANTGRTTFFAVKPLLEIVPKKIQVAVLVDRKHKLFPIHVDYVGLTLATTIQEHIKADMSDSNNMFVKLS